MQKKKAIKEETVGTTPDRNYPQHVEYVTEFNIPAGQGPERVDTFLTHTMEGATRTKVREAIDEGRVLINGQPVKPSRKVQPGDHIVCTVLKPPPLQLIPEDIPLDVYYEDEHILVVNKPAGLVVHPGFGNRYGTLVNALLYHFGQREAIEVETLDEEDAENSDTESDEEVEINLDFKSDVIRPGIVHRLDKDTSGLLVVAKNSAAHAALAAQFKNRTVQREYNTIVWGVVKEQHQVIENQLGRSHRDRMLFQVLNRGGKTAKSEFTVLERYDFATLLKCKLHTGRTHQIRVHTAHIGHIVLGDERYAGRETAARGTASQFRKRAEEALRIMKRQALHARTLGFYHPVTQQWMEYTSPLPEDFEKVLKLLRETAPRN
ncbi:MAG: RluA family pseudouridine synthase [Bacteroidota bacterium]